MPGIPEMAKARAVDGGVSPSAVGRAQLPRLLELIMAIQSERFPNARDLAERCEVSRRTIYRDLDTLAAAGIEVRYRADRQGYQLLRAAAFHPPGLREEEVLALLVVSRLWNGPAGIELIRHARDGARKLVQALPAEGRNRVLTRAEPFPEDSAPQAPPRDRKPVYDAIREALLQRRQIRIWYRDHAESGAPLEATKLSPYRLILERRTWHAVGRSTYHRQVRVFRVPWIERATPTGDPYAIPPRFNLEKLLGMAWGVERGEGRHEVRLRFGARAAPEIREAVWHRSQRLEVLPDRRVDLHLVVDGLDEILGWVLGFGDQVEVLAPPALRERVRDVAARVARIHVSAPLAPSESGPASSRDLAPNSPDPSGQRRRVVDAPASPLNNGDHWPSVAGA